MIRLKIKKHNDKNIKLQALEGILHVGFSTFLCNIQPGEIKCDEFSKNALISASEKDGLNGLKIWNNNRIAWGNSNETIIMPIDEISNMSDSDGWLSKIKAK